MGLLNRQYPAYIDSLTSLVPRPHLFLEVGLVNNEHFLGCAESAVCKNVTTNQITASTKVT